MSFRPGSPEFHAAIDRHLVNEADRQYHENESGCCDRPGRHGCGQCECCERWADYEFDREHEAGL